jgi:ATP/ADP translocase
MTVDPETPPSSAYARFKNNPAPLGSLTLGVFAVVGLVLDHTRFGRENGAFEGALIAAIVAMITGAAGLLMAIKYGAASALLSAAGFVMGLVVLIVGLSSSPS